jgi:hypothetical protein
MTNPVGRPTKYDPAYCEAVIDAGSEGKTLAEMAEACDVHRETLKDWVEQYPEFSDAVKRGLQKAQAWWEEKGKVATFGGYEGFNATSYIFQMKNRFKEDWADIHTRELTGKDGGPIKTETRNQSIDDLVAEAKALGIDPSAFMDDGK